MHLSPAIQLVLAGLMGIAPVLANNWANTWDFNNHWYIAKLSAPDWHFDYYELCYPGSAYWDGKKSAPGKYWSVDGREGVDGCAPDSGKDQAHPFPTYYRVRECKYGDHTEWHVLYDVFFAYSTNILGMHDYDWEWAVVKWEKVSGQTDKWQRKSIVLAAHGKTTEWKWADFPATNSEGSEWNWRKNAENPIIKFGYDGHGLEANYKSLGKWYRARDWLVDGANFPVTSWGKADSPPNTFEGGGTRDLCWAM
ncbi:hypothetical protein B0H66DRAFT_605772 [Apodospora peruviana]|uniref:Uncharacterized protein n=1 Tax=Apodospora peruviana TaxID=516989 RepID=A0AAE0M0W5_9PEZI|nr:hypothetical protein B0H66DRAFT_605772 [Apodospora peruviana]